MAKTCGHSERVGNYCEHCLTGTGSKGDKTIGVLIKPIRRRLPNYASASDSENRLIRKLKRVGEQ